MATSRTTMTTAITALLVAFLATVGTPAPATAAPTPNDPGAAQISDLQKQIIDKQHQLEVLTEQYLEAGQVLQDQTQKTVAAQSALDRASAAVAAARATVSEMAADAYKGPRLAGVAAMMTSASPQEALDRLNTLNRLAAHQATQLATLAQEQDHASQVAQTVQATTDAAAATAADIAANKAQLEAEVPLLEAQLATLTASQRAQVLTVSGGQAVQPDPAAVELATSPPVAGDGGTAAAQAAVQAALTKLGKPYSWGATGPDAFDCSGLLLWSYGQAGVSLPRTSTAQSGLGPRVPMTALMPGDLLWSPGHIGMYIGNGQMVHAPTTGDVVKVIQVSSMSWSSANRPTG